VADPVAAPALGEHRDAMLRGLLGLDDDRIAMLESEGAFGGQPG
jgi:crotonobetainyl-CoA:carnitine CoA-transferase CaiB-like acyl-CoA transferase